MAGEVGSEQSEKPLNTWAESALSAQLAAIAPIAEQSEAPLDTWAESALSTELAAIVPIDVQPASQGHPQLDDVLVKDFDDEGEQPPAFGPNQSIEEIVEVTRQNMEVEEVQELEEVAQPNLPGTTQTDVEALPEIEDCAQVSVPNELRVAAVRGDARRVRSLLEAGTSANLPFEYEPGSGEFVTLLHILAERADVQTTSNVAKELVGAKASLNARSSLGCTPLIRACFHNYVGIAELLLEHSAHTDVVDDDGRTALATATMLLRDSQERLPTGDRSHSAQLVRLLVEKKADIEDSSSTGLSPLLHAINHNNADAITALLASGANVVDGGLHKAIECADIDCARALIDAGADPTGTNDEGRTPLDVAFTRGDEAITNLLRDSLADWEKKMRKSTGWGKVKSEKLSSQRQVSCDRISHQATLNRRPSIASRASSAKSGGKSHSSKDSPDENHGWLRKGQSKELKKGGSAGRLMSGADRPTDRKSRVLKNVRRLSQSLGLKMRKTDPISLFCRKVNKNNYFQGVMFLALLGALFLPDIWILADFEDNYICDILLTVVLGAFLFEFTIQCIGLKRAYWWTFFFWMDIVGNLSLLLDITYIFPLQQPRIDSGADSGNFVIMRAARVAKLGARAGRFTKLVKLLRFIPGLQQQGADQGTAKVISGQLMMALSTRVSCLIIVMVIISPAFELYAYPTQDWSMKNWINILEDMALNDPSQFAEHMLEFKRFFREFSYFPCNLQLKYDLPMRKEHLGNPTRDDGSHAVWDFNRPVPKRWANEVHLESQNGHIKAVFNFTVVCMMDAGMNSLLIFVIIFLLLGFSLLLSNSVSAIVLRPLEQLLGNLRNMASTIFSTVKDMEQNTDQVDDDDIEDGGNVFGAETVLLEKVVKKIAVLSEITMKKTPIDAATMEQLGENDRAVLQGAVGDAAASPGGPAKEQAIGEESVDEAEDEANKQAQNADFLELSRRFLAEAGLTQDLVDSWEFSPLDIDETRNQAVSVYFLCPANHSVDVDAGTLAKFVETVAEGYLDQPYHNWFHAVDVTHSVYRMLCLCSAERFFSNQDRFALLVGSVCHDIGHPGLNNPFMVETSHELALRYNDKSPLENMHCAKLFEIAKNPKSAIFSTLPKAEYQEVRKASIEAILHTDMTHHFSMIKDLQMLYEMNVATFCGEISPEDSEASSPSFPSKEIVDLFRQNDVKKNIRNLMLHAGDVSNPMKPFRICEAWAFKVLEEFFLQGDKEKEIGITVQMLNDRDKVKKELSQIGFIEFLVAPLAFQMVRILAPLEPLAENLINNIKQWQEAYIKATPGATAEELQGVSDRIARLENKYEDQCRRTKELRENAELRL